MKRSLFRLSLVLATIALVSFAGLASADDGVPFRLSGTETSVELVGVTGDTFTLRITVSGEGTIGSYEEIAFVTFTPVGDNTWKFDATTTIYVLDDEGMPTGDEINTTGFGTFANGRNEGSFRIMGGAGLYQDASGSGAFKYIAPTETYTGVIHD
jgi:hypothetical protein